MKKYFFLFVSFLSIGLHAQSYFFFASYSDKGSAKNYLCFNAGPYVLKPITSEKEYDLLKNEFYNDKAHLSPTTKMLSAKHPFIIYKFKVKREGWNCDYTTISALQGMSLVKIYEELQRKKVMGKFLQEPEILHVYKPESNN